MTDSAPGSAPGYGCRARPMPLRYTNRIPNLLGRADRAALTPRELAELLGIDHGDQSILDQALEILESSGSRREGSRWSMASAATRRHVRGQAAAGSKGIWIRDPRYPLPGGRHLRAAWIARGGHFRRPGPGEHFPSKGIQGRGPSGRVEEIVERQQTSFAGDGTTPWQDLAHRIPMGGALQGQAGHP